jgi:hypothetical protein
MRNKVLGDKMVAVTRSIIYNTDNNTSFYPLNDINPRSNLYFI